jgi:hypothetical protein
MTINDLGFIEYDEENRLCEVIRKASGRRDYTYIVSEIRPPEESSDEITVALDYLGDLAKTSPELFVDVTLSQVFQVMRGHIVHPCPDVSKLYVPGEAVVYCHLRHLPTLTRVYGLFHALMPQILSEVTDSFVRELMTLLHTSSQQEQELVLGAVKDIFESQFQPLVLKSMFNIMAKYKEGYESSYAISPVIQFLVNYFASLDTVDLSEYFVLFRTLIYPLVTTHDCMQFYFKFQRLAEFFYRKDSTTAIWCIRYLFRHWPLTDSAKQVVFLHQVQCLMCSLSASYLGTLGEAFCSKLRLSFASDNFRVAQAAIEIFKDQVFTKTYIACCEKHVLSLVPILEKTSVSHWNSDVRKVAAEIAVLIRQTSNKRSAPMSRSDDAATVVQNWQTVLGLAGMNHQGIDFSSSRLAMSREFSA